jgi:hypothetical protein
MEILDLAGAEEEEEVTGGLSMTEAGRADDEEEEEGRGLLGPGALAAMGLKPALRGAMNPEGVRKPFMEEAVPEWRWLPRPFMRSGPEEMVCLLCERPGNAFAPSPCLLGPLPPPPFPFFPPPPVPLGLVSDDRNSSWCGADPLFPTDNIIVADPSFSCRFRNASFVPVGVSPEAMAA